MKIFRTTLLAACALLLTTTRALAHHSDAMFDREQVRELSGTIKEFQFTNRHTWVQVNVKDANDKVVEGD